LRITSGFSHQVGLGSSAAVTVATLAALTEYAGRRPAPRRLLEEGRAVIRAAQGRGSGADVAASVYGGVLVYQLEPPRVARLPRLPPLLVYYSGAKRPTPEVIALVAALRRRRRAFVDDIFRRMDRGTAAAARAIRAGDRVRLGAVLNEQQALMEALGLSNAALDRLIAGLRATPGLTGAKISGSGLGDCVIGVGAGRPPLPAAARVRVRLAAAGVRREA